jgi:hypothetical protein
MTKRKSPHFFGYTTTLGKQSLSKNIGHQALIFDLHENPTQRLHKKVKK